MSATYTPDELGAESARRLALCTTALTATPTVLRGRRKIDDEMMPCGVTVEGDAAVVERQGLTNKYLLRMECAWHLYVLCDPDAPNVAAHAALREAKRVLWSSGATMGGKVRDLEFVGTDIAPRVDGGSYVLAVLTWAATIIEDMANPL